MMIQLTENKLNFLWSYGYGIYSIDIGYAIADLVEGKEGFYLTGSDLGKLLSEGIEQNISQDDIPVGFI